MKVQVSPTPKRNTLATSECTHRLIAPTSEGLFAYVLRAPTLASGPLQPVRRTGHRGALWTVTVEGWSGAPKRVRRARRGGPGGVGLREGPPNAGIRVLPW